MSGKTAWQTSPQRPQYVTKGVVDISKKQQSMQFIYVYCVLLKTKPRNRRQGQKNGVRPCDPHPPGVSERYLEK